MRIEDFISGVLLHIQSGIDQFNQESEESDDDVTVSYPKTVSFEFYVNNEGCLGGDHKISMEVEIRQEKAEETEDNV